MDRQWIEDLSIVPPPRGVTGALPVDGACPQCGCIDWQPLGVAGRIIAVRCRGCDHACSIYVADMPETTVADARALDATWDPEGLNDA